MQSKRVSIPNHIITHVEAHPEEYGEYIVTLENGMNTDIYTSDSGEIYTFTNDKKLVDYIDTTKRRIEKMKKYVKIQSSRNIQVTAGLQSINMTDPNQPIPDKLKVQPLWSKEKIIIRNGAGWYPAEITEWPTVKALNTDGVITVGEFVDVLPSNAKPEEVAETLKREQSLKEGKLEIERQVAAQKATQKTQKLSDLTLDKE